MIFIHFENMISRSKNHFISFGKNNSLKNINCLCDISHQNSVGVLIEDIKSQCSYNSITHCILLIQKSGISARLNIIPCSPFINYQLNPFLRINRIHNCKMIVNKLFHFISLTDS